MTSPVLTLTPVLDRWSPDCPFWPVDRTVRFAVPRRPTLRQVGSVVWALIGHHVTAADLSIAAADPVAAIETYLTSADDDRFAAGGLRIGTRDIVIEPGCCAGLDEWREWLRVVGGDVIDLGHEPDVLMEQRGPLVRVWADKERLAPGEEPGPHDRYVDIPRDALPGLLGEVQRDLLGFLAALRPWAYGIAAQLADPLAAEVDRRLEISAPLGI